MFEIETSTINEPLWVQYVLAIIIKCNKNNIITKNEIFNLFHPSGMTFDAEGYKYGWDIGTLSSEKVRVIFEIDDVHIIVLLPDPVPLKL